ncbi:hypothetical protein E1B28_009379 [Marasmius oreades]|uniref:Uncharacterized protein n=1 Tax=Marasmius oreades TaxID=181124 RepID=A0A9P7USS1_9AGAR|nr:uncharacterized protein E1B28_009379 [Marasmius oreades]KAG7093092.1 hypothetical protein E1B28_009379 [Marasmius oreades]
MTEKECTPKRPPAALEEKVGNPFPSAESQYSHTIALHLAHTYLPSITHLQLPGYTTRSKRFIQFARSKSRNKEYLNALKTVENLLSRTAVALRNFDKSLNGEDSDTNYSPSSPSTNPTVPHSDWGDDVWVGNGTSSSASSDSLQTSLNPAYSDASTYSDSELSTHEDPGSGDWTWIANLIIHFWETVRNEKCDLITNPQRNFWSRFMEARYRDWLAGDVASLALDYRDSVDKELRYSSFDFAEYVEEILTPGRRYGLLLDALSERQSLGTPSEVDADGTVVGYGTHYPVLTRHGPYS